jgi:hypothetical protein
MRTMVLVYKSLQNWVILFGQMLFFYSSTMEHMGIAIHGYLDKTMD